MSLPVVMSSTQSSKCRLYFPTTGDAPVRTAMSALYPPLLSTPHHTPHHTPPLLERNRGSASHIGKLAARPTSAHRGHDRSRSLVAALLPLVGLTACGKSSHRGRERRYRGEHVTCAGCAPGGQMG